ncbi:MAG: ArsR family transcriptional regulator [Deltaproteobacteria bacterium]|nr:MAG: ArsR family transcriptional regulator [Deltaproteobacteria bacterium]
MAKVDLEKAAAFFKVLGNPVRLRIMKELYEGQKCVGEVESCVRITQANVSQHLSLLKLHGLVDCIKKGNTRCYYLTEPELMEKVFQLIEYKKVGR